MTKGNKTCESKWSLNWNNNIQNKGKESENSYQKLKRPQ